MGPGSSVTPPAQLHLRSHLNFPLPGLAAALEQDFGELAGRVKGSRRQGKGHESPAWKGPDATCSSLLGPHCLDASVKALGEGAFPIRDLVTELNGVEALRVLEAGKAGDGVVLFTHPQSPRGRGMVMTLEPLARMLNDRASVNYVDCQKNMQACVESGIREVPQLVLYQAVMTNGWSPASSSVKSPYTEEVRLRRSLDVQTVASQIYDFVLDYQRQDSFLPRVPSQVSQARQQMEVVNRAKEAVKIFWMNYANAEVLYFVLHPGERVKTHSFVSHVWNARTVNSKDLVGQWAVRAQPFGEAHLVEIKEGMDNSLIWWGEVYEDSDSDDYEDSDSDDYKDSDSEDYGDDRDEQEGEAGKGRQAKGSRGSFAEEDEMAQGLVNEVVAESIAQASTSEVSEGEVEL